MVDRAQCSALFRGLGNPPSLKTQARIVPHYRGGQMRGWKLVGLRPRTLLSEVGLKSGDVLVSVNGKELLSLSHVASLAMQWRQSFV